MSLNCLSEGQTGNLGKGAERCAKQHCVDKSSKACVAMGLNNELARAAEDHACAALNEAVGVDDCAEGTYCIDSESIPSSCVDLRESSTCYIGREKTSKICVYASTTGPN